MDVAAEKQQLLLWMCLGVLQQYVEESISNQDMDEPIGESRIRTRAQGQVARGPLRGRRTPRVCHKQFSARCELGLEVLHDGRHCFGRVAADEKDRAGVCDIGKRERQSPIEPECAQTCCGS